MTSATETLLSCLFHCFAHKPMGLQANDDSPEQIQADVTQHNRLLHFNLKNAANRWIYSKDSIQQFNLLKDTTGLLPVLGIYTDSLQKSSSIGPDITETTYENTPQNTRKLAYQQLCNPNILHAYLSLLLNQTLAQLGWLKYKNTQRYLNTYILQAYNLITKNNYNSLKLDPLTLKLKLGLIHPTTGLMTQTLEDSMSHNERRLIELTVQIIYQAYTLNGFEYITQPNKLYGIIYLIDVDPSVIQTLRALFPNIQLLHSTCSPTPSLKKPAINVLKAKSISQTL